MLQIYDYYAMQFLQISNNWEHENFLINLQQKQQQQQSRMIFFLVSPLELIIKELKLKFIVTCSSGKCVS